MLYPFAAAADVLRAWRAFTEAAPDEVTSEVALWSVPPDPALPAELHGRPVASVAGLYAGPVADGEGALRPLRALGAVAPLLDLSGPAPYVAVQSAFDAAFPDGLRYYWTSLYLDRLEDATITTTVELAGARPTPETPVVLRHLGGAVARVPEGATAYGNRAARFNLSLDATWARPEDDARAVAWARDGWRVLRERPGAGGVYVNFAGLGEEGEPLLRAAHGAGYDRLVALARRYDPTGLFRPPAPGPDRSRTSTDRR